MAERQKTRVVGPEAPVFVQVEHIGKRFGNLRALEDVSFEVRKGEILGFLGPNGAGKTTAMRILAGYFPPSQGNVFIGGEELFRNPARVKRRLGYLPESIHLYPDMKVLEYLDFVSRLKGIPAKNRRREIEDKLTKCGLWNVKNRLIGQLSKGFRQRLGLAQALAGNPDVLLLDEPTSGLDPKQIMEIRALIRDMGRERTLILSTHILPEVSMVCDRVLILNEGRVVATGTPEELEAGLKARHEIFIVLGDRHRKEEALGLLKKLEGVNRINVTEEKGDRLYLSLSVSRGMDLCPEITRVFVENRIPLLELRSGRLSLEEIFLKIVVNESAEQA